MVNLRLHPKIYGEPLITPDEIVPLYVVIGVYQDSCRHFVHLVFFCCANWQLGSPLELLCSRIDKSIIALFTCSISFSILALSLFFHALARCSSTPIP
jgi:hypothetical protein